MIQIDRQIGRQAGRLVPKNGKTDVIMVVVSIEFSPLYDCILGANTSSYSMLL